MSFGIYTVGDDMTKHGAGSPNRNEQFAKRIKSWLLDDEYSVSDVTHPNFVWWIIATLNDASGFGVGVTMHRSKPEMIFIAAGLEITKAQQNKLTRMSASERRSFVNKLKITLLNHDVRLSFKGNPLEGISISQRVFTDNLTKDDFLKKAYSVYRATYTAALILEELSDDTTLDQIAWFSGSETPQ